MNSDMGDRVNLSLDSQIGLLAKYIEDNFQSFISDDDLVVETAIKIMEKLRVERSRDFNIIQKLESKIEEETPKKAEAIRLLEEALSGWPQDQCSERYVLVDEALGHLKSVDGLKHQAIMSINTDEAIKKALDTMLEYYTYQMENSTGHAKEYYMGKREACDFIIKAIVASDKVNIDYYTRYLESIITNRK